MSEHWWNPADSSLEPAAGSGRVETHVHETSGGKIRGVIRDGIYVVKGVPYGANTGGVNRFQRARPITWGGVRNAIALGAQAPQNVGSTQAGHLTWLRDTTGMSEDCLVLNLFTPSVERTARLPVMVYLHGGSFASGSGGAPGIDGSNLAKRGVVAITLNHRLNLFGHLYLASAEPEKYADSGNVGLLDLVMALKWIKENAESFGGDAGNVTIFGQSGGGSKVAALMAMPEARGLFSKAIIQSASSLLSLATQEEAERNTYYFLKEVGIDKSRFHQLHELPAEALLSAMPAAIRAAGRIDNYRPVVDGGTVPCQPFSQQAAESSSDIPLMMGWCENEQRLTFASKPAIYQLSKPEAVGELSRLLGVGNERVEDLIRTYAAFRPTDTAGDLVAQIYGDQRYRRNVTRAAELRTSSPGSPTYMYMLNWKTQVLDGLLRTPHTLCVAFAFSNVDIAAGITGTGEDRYALQDEISQAWVQFARSGNPNHVGIPFWSPYDSIKRPTLVFDHRTELVDDPAREERLALALCPPYSPAIGEGMLR